MCLLRQAQGLDRVQSPIPHAALALSQGPTKPLSPAVVEHAYNRSAGEAKNYVSELHSETMY